MWKRLGRRSRKTYRERKPPKIKILIQKLDETGRNSLGGVSFSVVGAELKDVAAAVREALMEKYATTIGKRGRIVFIPYEAGDSSEGRVVRCPYCNAIIGFDPHSKDCPLHEILVLRWSST